MSSTRVRMHALVDPALRDPRHAPPDARLGEPAAGVGAEQRVGRTGVANSEPLVD